MAIAPWDRRRVLTVATGGVAGAVARWAVLAVLPTPAGFPWPVLAVNVAGCALVGFLLAQAALLAGTPTAARLRDGGALGFCGGFTTFSTFTVQVAHLLDDHRAATAAAYVAASVAVGVAAVGAGAAVGRRAPGRPHAISDEAPR